MADSKNKRTMKKIIALFAMLAMVAGVAVAAPSEKAEKKIVEAVFVTDLDCNHCAQKIYNTISYEKGIKDVVCDVPTKRVTVKFDNSKNSVEGLLHAFTTIKVKVFKWTCDGKNGDVHHDHAGHNHSHAGHKH